MAWFGMKVHTFEKHPIFIYYSFLLIANPNRPEILLARCKFPHASNTNRRCEPLRTSGNPPDSAENNRNARAETVEMLNPDVHGIMISMTIIEKNLYKCLSRKMQKGIGNSGTACYLELGVRVPQSRDLHFESGCALFDRLLEASFNDLACDPMLEISTSHCPLSDY